MSTRTTARIIRLARSWWGVGLFASVSVAGASVSYLGALAGDTASIGTGSGLVLLGVAGGALVTMRNTARSWVVTVGHMAWCSCLPLALAHWHTGITAPITAIVQITMVADAWRRKTRGTYSGGPNDPYRGPT